ncbi:MAG: hypothetical protein Q8L13_13095 [Bradyrhizobium sp.]|nr:hypothetical protein [Bradyrhizobium sp.]MDP1867262.1 hypothetical protein [Bradyrhizobium sp.]
MRALCWQGKGDIRVDTDPKIQHPRDTNIKITAARSAADLHLLDGYQATMESDGKRSPDSCIDAFGCEASGQGPAAAVVDRGDHMLPQGWHDFDPRGLCRHGRQDSARRDLYRAAPQVDRSGRDRLELCRHSSGQPGRCAGDVQEVPRQGRRRHQGRVATRPVTPARSDKMFFPTSDR